MSITLQESFDSFLLDLQNRVDSDQEMISHAEQAFTFFSEYLIYYSDLFHADEVEEETDPQDWEASLEHFINQLAQNEYDTVPSLEGLPIDRIDGDYLRDFIAWHLLREPSINSLIIQAYAETMIDWLVFVHHKRWIDDETYEYCSDCVADALPDAKRAVMAAHLLLYHIRMGGGIAPRLRGKRFNTFKEGHARVSDIKKGAMWLSFDSAPDGLIGPVKLPETILQQLRLGDVIDIELGKRSKEWTIVDIGPVYPALVYVAAEEMDLPEKQT
ncbi:MAG: hypothetical protein AUK35_02020 [Zetaproteobacteria bacterium CG2_30_46_52]|nr:MAG: hypothetical protein AUK35_02020 [Zetaproteobacteria bacterium CG2_30_46_52]